MVPTQGAERHMPSANVPNSELFRVAFCGPSLTGQGTVGNDYARALLRRVVQ